jgi:putative ABC transport system permease protein
VGDRLARWLGLLGFGARYALARLTGTERVQSGLSVAGVAITVALVLSVTSISVGLAVGPATTSGDANYWIVPPEGQGSVVTDVGGQRLGGVHAATDRVRDIEGVTAATPLLASLSAVDVGDDREYVLVFGVIPDENVTAAGIPTAGLTTGDPYYADGDLDGPRTGETLLTPSASDALNVSPGETITLATGAEDANRTFAAADVVEPRTAGVGQLPVMVVHLSELQVLTGAASGDTADRLLVTASDPGVKDRLEGVYPGADVLAHDELVREQATNSQTTMATALAALVVAVTVGCLFIATTMGFDLAADSTSRAVLAAVGFSRRSRAAITLVRSLLTCFLGGSVGVLLWGGVVLAVNYAGAAAGVTSGAVAYVHPAFVAYGLGIATLIGLLTAPYLLLASGRANVTEVLST